jgi:thiamine transport system permease protein
MTRDGPRWSASAVALAALPLGFLLAMLLAPTMRLLAEAGSAGTGGFDRSAWLAPVLDPYLRWRLLWSVVQALLTCGLVLVIGVPLAWVLARWEFAGRRWLLRALMLPFVVPTLVAAMGVLARYVRSNFAAPAPPEARKRAGGIRRTGDDGAHMQAGAMKAL